MTEVRVGFLSNIASKLSQNNESLKLLKSYYMMRCNELTKGYGLPSQHFSTKIRCPRCCLEWSRDTEVKLRPIKLSKRRRKIINSQVKTENNLKNNEKRKCLLRINEMEQICTFCKIATTTTLTKPEKEYVKVSKEQDVLKLDNQKIPEVNKPQKKGKTNKNKLKNNETVLKRGDIINVYSNAYDVFSLRNEKNTLSNAVKEPAKVIKNSKKKKDKYAGLCQKAVLASAKLKQQQMKPKDEKLKNKLNLFLKPSSS